jgi:cytochrome c6
MRHALTTRFVLVAAGVAVLAAALFAILANLPTAAPDRTEVILGLEPDITNGPALYNEVTQPPCAVCHTLRDAGAESDRASSLDVLRPSARLAIDSLVAGTVRAHDAQGYEHHLTNQQMANLAAYIERVAGD